MQERKCSVGRGDSQHQLYTQTTTTGSDGTFEIGNLPLADYTVTFTKDGYASIVKKVVMADFVDGIATTDVRMGERKSCAD